jgi:protein gp37
LRPNRANLPEAVSTSAMLGPLPCSNRKTGKNLHLAPRNRAFSSHEHIWDTNKAGVSATFLRPKEAFPLIGQNRDLIRQNRVLFATNRRFDRDNRCSGPSESWRMRMIVGAARLVVALSFVRFTLACPLRENRLVVPLLFSGVCMADGSSIEWTDATWNPVTGCTKISRGCDNCYAERFSERFRGVPGHPFEHGFDLTLRAARLEQPLTWRRPRTIFVNSMSDLFHKEVPREFIDQVFDTMERADWHVFQLLTKRSSLMRRYLRNRYPDGRCPRHIWCGVSVEDRQARSRIVHLRGSPAGARFLSIEPLLGPVGELDLTGIDWVIAGGESGPKARAMNPDWVRSVRDQCVAQGVRFFFKQWGGLRPKDGGRELDGREWNGFPSQSLPELRMESQAA